MISDMNYVFSEEEVKELREGQGITLEEFITWEASARDSINVRRVYVDICEDLVAGILLSQIVYWFLPKEDGESKLSVQREGRYWLAKSREDWWKECRITAKQFDRVSTILEDNKFIETRVFKFNGLAVKHIGLNMQAVFLRVKALLTKGKEQLNYPKVNLDITQRSIPYKEAETTTETTSENTNPNLIEGFSLVPEESNRKPKKRTEVLEIKLPQWLPLDEWNGWLEMRAGMRKRATPLAKKYALEELDALRQSGQNIIEVIKRAIARNWLSFYAVTQAQSNGNGYQNGQQSHTNGAGRSGHLLDHLPGLEEIRARQKADDERLAKRREARGM
jgi:hypothetical protein